MHSQPTHAVAVFDDENRSSGWRHQRLPDYKAGRPPMPEELHNEMHALRAAFEQRGVPCWSASGNEADDLAATLAVKVTQAGHQATIVSTRCLHYAPPLSNAASRAGPPAATKPMT